MPVTYSKAQRERAKKDKLHLVTLCALGVEFQAPVNREEAERILGFIETVLQKRYQEVREKAKGIEPEGKADV
jgi:hypothetical protein